MLYLDDLLAVASLFELSVLVELLGIYGAALEVASMLEANQAIINPCYVTGPMFKDIINLLETEVAA